jgi:hypothetical protein
LANPAYARGGSVAELPSVRSIACSSAVAKARVAKRVTVAETLLVGGARRTSFARLKIVQ